MMARYKQRKNINRLALLMSILAMAVGIFWLLWIVLATVVQGWQGINSAVFTQSTPPPEDVGGLANAIFGTLLMSTLATLIATPIGVLSGVYLVEYGRGRWLGKVVEFVNDILLSAPSIVLGLFIYTVVVVPMGGFSALAGALALALIVIPVVLRTTISMLLLVPNSLREAAYALGTPKWKVIMHVTLKASLVGVVTGVLLAIARITGETAPLLFTALSNQFWSHDVLGPMASLPVTIFKFAMSPYQNWQQLAWAGVLLITVAVLLLNIIARLLTRNKH